MNKNLARAKVIITALPTQMTLLASAITVFAAQLALVLPDRAAGITRWSVTIVGCLFAGTLALRKLTPLKDQSQVGILPQGRPAPSTVAIDMTPPVD